MDVGRRALVVPDRRGFRPQFVMVNGDLPGVNNYVSDERRVVPSPADSLGPVLGQPGPIQRAVDVGIEIPARIRDGRAGCVAAGAIFCRSGCIGPTAGGYIAIDGIIGSLGAPPPPFLFGKLKDGGCGLAGNARFPLGQPALLGGDKAAERAAFPPIDRVIPLVAVFAGLPGFGFGKGVGLVNAALKGLAPVLRQGFQNGGSAIVVGKGLPVGAVPGNGTGVGLCCPPPPSKKISRTKQRCRLHSAGT